MTTTNAITINTCDTCDDPDRRALHLEATDDAGLMREQLAIFLADWREARFIDSAKKRRFDRFVRRLARMARMTTAEVLADLRRDADLLLEEIQH